MPTEFTPWSALAGGGLIGLAAVLLLALTGRIAGVSGIANAAFGSDGDGRAWRLAFLLGLPLGAAAWWLLAPGLGLQVGSAREGFPLLPLLAGGALVGFGTRLGAGCTSGHGICGLARFSPRSLAAVAVFIAAGVVTVSVVRHLWP